MHDCICKEMVQSPRMNLISSSIELFTHKKTSILAVLI